MSSSSTTTKRSRSARWWLVVSTMGLGVWWLCSILLHTALFGLIYVASPPVPGLKPESKEFEMTISPSRVRDVVDEIREQESKRFEDRVEELKQIKEDLDRLNAERIAQYNEVMREEVAGAPQRITAAADDAVAAQEEALVSQAEAEKALAKLKAAHEKSQQASNPEGKQAAEEEAAAAATAALEAQDAAELAQNKAAAAQERIGEQLQLMGEAPTASEAHLAAVTAQTDASKSQESSESSVRQISKTKQTLDSVEQTAAREQAGLEKLTNQLSDAQSVLATRQEALAAAQTQIEAAKAEAAANAGAAAEADANAKAAAEELKRLAGETKTANEALKKEQAALQKLQQELGKAEGQAKSAQDAAAKQQKKVNDIAPAAPEAAPDATPAAEPTPVSEAVAKEQSVLEKALAQVATAEAALAAKREALAAAGQKIEELKEAVAAAKEASSSATEKSTAASEEKKRLANAARQTGESIRKHEAAFAKSRKEVAQSEAQIKRSEEAAAKQRKKAEEATAALQSRKNALDNLVSESKSGQEKSTAAQQASLEIQMAAKSAIAKAASDFSAENAAASLAAEASLIPLPEPADPNSLADLYEQAKAAEDAIAETFKNVRAAELAALRKIPLSEAMELTEVAKPDRPELNNEILESDISDVKGVREQEQAINAAVAQMNSMVALAERMRELAADSGAELSIAQIKAKSAQSERMEQLAMEDSGMRAKDLTHEMSASAEGSQAAHEAMMLQGSMGVATAAAAWGADPMNPHALAKLAQAMKIAAMLAQGGGGSQGTGQGPGYGGGGNAFGDYGTVKSPGGVPGIATVDPKEYRPLHGRTVRSGMVSIEQGRNPAWLFVDTWHIIGPWPNPGRKNLNTKFPPETVVDLDAVYQGGRKDEAPIPIRWEFFQLPYVNRGKERTPATSLIVPPGMKDYEIFYAYTELWFDVAADLWVAIGSDDQSKVWINDQLVWKSGDAHKAWVPNEGLRKIHFRKGINRVLYRLENGQHSGGFSFMVCLSEPK